MAWMRIVLVDDHELLRDGLRARIERNKINLKVVGEAGNASDAYEVIDKTLPDLVVLDLNLPDKSGSEVAAIIRSKWPQIKVLILTGCNNVHAAGEAIRAGADGFIRKEDAAEELLRAIPIIMSGQTYFSPGAATSIAQTLRNNPEAKVAKGPELAERELDVLRGLADGFSYKEIAAEMKVSVRTVETYRARIVKKLKCDTRAELVRYAVRQGLVKA